MVFATICYQKKVATKTHSGQCLSSRFKNAWFFYLKTSMEKPMTNYSIIKIRLPNTIAREFKESFPKLTKFSHNEVLEKIIYADLVDFIVSCISPQYYKEKDIKEIFKV